MNKRLNITVHGRVQGVGFRAFVKRSAQELGISGTVKNQPDGTVYIEAEGSYDKLNALVEKCKSGPSFSVVKNVVVKDGQNANYSGFQIVH